MLHYVNVPLFDIQFLHDAPFNFLLFNVPLFYLTMLNIALFTVALSKVALY